MSPKEMGVDGEEQKQAALEHHTQVQLCLNTVHLQLYCKRTKHDFTPKEHNLNLTLEQGGHARVEACSLTYSAAKTACLVHVRTAVHAQ